MKRDIVEGTVIEGLRYVEGTEVKTVSGRVISINYTIPTKLNYNTKNPTDCLNKDVNLQSITIDASEQYTSKIITVPVIEIVEDEGVEGVERMKFYTSADVTISMDYTNGETVTHELKIGDRITGIKVLMGTPEDDIIGDFDIIGFGYMAVNGKLKINSLILKNSEYGTIVVPIGSILYFKDLDTFVVATYQEAMTAIDHAKDGELIRFEHDVDASEHALTVTGAELEFNSGDYTIIGGSSLDSGLTLRNAKVKFTGGEIVSNDPYDSRHASGVVKVQDGSEFILDGGKVTAVIESDPVNLGQFGLVNTGSSNITINNGEVTTGWYCCSTNGSASTSQCVTTINGGKLTSVSDFAIYQPCAGKVIVNDGEIIGGAGAISANNGYVEINGGVLKTLGTGDTGEWADGTSGQVNAAINLNGKYGPVTCVITGGTFISSGDADLIITGTRNTVTVKISGGLFSKPVKQEWCDEGYIPTNIPTADGFYTVVKTA